MTVDVTHRPARLSALGSVAAACVAAWLLLPSAAGPTLPIVAGGILFLVAGDAAKVRGHWLLAGIAGALGLGIALAGVGVGVTRLARFEEMARVAVTGIGVVVVAAGVFPLRGDGSRALVKFGAALAFLGLLLCGVLKLLTLETMVLVVIALVVAVDLGENAIALGEQLGREAETRAIEASHAVASVGVGAVAVGVGRLAPGLGSEGLSLSGLVLLLVAMLALAVALYD